MPVPSPSFRPCVMLSLVSSGVPDPRPVPVRVGLWRIAAEWGRIGCLGFGGPPAHISQLRRLCVVDRGWLNEVEFEDGIAAANLLPGPASTQLAIFCAWRLRGVAGALVGGLCFITPGLVLILWLASLFLGHPSRWVQGAAAGAGAAVAAVALRASLDLVPASRRRARGSAASRRWVVYLIAGAVAGVFWGRYLVLVLLACGLFEVGKQTAHRRKDSGRLHVLGPFAAAVGASAGGMGALAWTALKVGLLSYGGGFVIIPLMQSDAVVGHHWMTNAQFLNAVALGQLTPGPVLHTVAVVGYAAGGLEGALFAAAVAFAPSFAMVLAGAAHFDRLRSDQRVQAFLTGAGPAAIGAIAGSAAALARALDQPWQFAILAAAGLWLLVARRGVVAALLLAAAAGAAAVAAGAPLSP